MRLIDADAFSRFMDEEIPAETPDQMVYKAIVDAHLASFDNIDAVPVSILAEWLHDVGFTLPCVECMETFADEEHKRCRAENKYGACGSPERIAAFFIKNMR